MIITSNRTREIHDALKRRCLYHWVGYPDAARELAILKARSQTRDHVFGNGKGKEGFKGWDKFKTLLDKVTGVTDWTLHDLRRTTRTGMGSLDVPPHVSEGVLNHLPPTLTRIYDQGKYRAQRREALDKWAKHIMEIVGPTSPKLSLVA